MKTLKQLLSEKAIQTVVSISPEGSVLDALEQMAQHRIGALPVMENNQLIGIISERDYAREIELKNRTASTTRIAEVMSTDLKCAQPTDTVEDAMNMMSNFRIRHLPVMDDNKMIGILSIGDLVKETIEYQASLITQLESYIQG